MYVYIKLKNLFNVDTCDYCDPTIKFLYHFSLYKQRKFSRVDRQPCVMEILV